jgi:large subunit ribosomal protein L15
MRLPKFGFSSRVNNKLKEINLKHLDGIKKISLETLKENKIISKTTNKVKIFGAFDLTSKIEVEGIKVSKGAKKSIEKAGGKVIELNEMKNTLKEEKKEDDK